MSKLKITDFYLSPRQKRVCLLEQEILFSSGNPMLPQGRTKTGHSGLLETDQLLDMDGTMSKAIMQSLQEKKCNRFAKCCLLFIMSEFDHNILCLSQAHKTLDLRRRLIHLRATKEGLDLRWKIVANMVLEMRNRARTNPRIQPYPTPGGRPSYLRGK